MDRKVFTLFCDDIREEIGHKKSYIGVYANNLFIQTVPATLAKLCVAIEIHSPIEKPFEKLIIRLIRSDTETVIAEGAISEEEIQRQAGMLEKSVEEKEKYPDSDISYTYRGSFILSPFHIDAPFLMKVRVETESGELKGAGLKIICLDP